MNRLSGSRLGMAAAVFGAMLAASTAEAARVYVSIAPPAPIVEVQTVAPSPGHVWIGGYHRWDGHAYVWAPGRWALPPRPHAVWVAGHWSHHHVHGYYWVEGRWK
jgi:WXXGXW repeat (2 copies)